ncbi:hypothetical protein COL90_26770 [Bacillus toyonensis]|nr:hypothetical protein CN579_30160 [Bacillus toyonensis]PGA75635.1 hypothetical protein COL90_26770 [Bacillus toyonensis]
MSSSRRSDLFVSKMCLNVQFSRNGIVRPSSKTALWEINKKAVKTIKVLVNKADGRARIK